MLSNLDQGSQTANLKTVTHQTPNDYLPWNKHKNAIGSETKNQGVTVSSIVIFW